MNDFQLHLLLDALCQAYSLEELEEGRQIARALIRNLQMTPEAVESLLYGAYQLKRLRNGRSISSYALLEQ